MAEATTILEALKGVNAYPIPLRTLVRTAESRDLDPTGDATGEVLSSPAFRLASADLLLWLALAPDITQGGQSYSFTDEQRQQLRLRAQAVYDELGEEDAGTAANPYGYKGPWL